MKVQNDVFLIKLKKKCGTKILKNIKTQTEIKMNENSHLNN